jgi:hypothetical protein
VVVLSGIAGAAPNTYQTAVLADNPFVYYRQNETGGTTAADTSTSNIPGTYNGTPTYSVVGLGLSSDNGVAYDSTDNEMLSASVDAFGSKVGTSSYEFIFKVNQGFNTAAIQSLFGVYTAAANLPDVNLDLNTDGNDTGGVVANNTRLFIRGDNADANGTASVAGHFDNASLYDGNFHHLVFTFDASTVVPGPSGSGGFRAYVDGVEQTVVFTQVNGTIAPAGFSNFDVPATWASRNVRSATHSTTAVSREANVTIDETALYGVVLTPEQVAAHALSAGIPEPASFSLLAVGATALLRRGRRSRR